MRFLQGLFVLTTALTSLTLMSGQALAEDRSTPFITEAYYRIDVPPASREEQDAWLSTELIQRLAEFLGVRG